MIRTLAFSTKIINGSADLAQVERKLTIVQTFSQPIINSVFKDENGSLGFVVVRILVDRFINSFGFSSKMSKDQLDMIAVDTIDRFGYETLIDVILFFKMACSGFFGHTDRGVDSNLIFGKWFPLYLEKKASEREKFYKEQKEQLINHIPDLKAVKITYRKTMLKTLEKDQHAYIDKITKNMDRQLLEDTIDSWEKHSDMKKHISILKLKRRTIKQ